MKANAANQTSIINGVVPVKVDIRITDRSFFFFFFWRKPTDLLCFTNDNFRKADMQVISMEGSCLA